MFMRGCAYFQDYISIYVWLDEIHHLRLCKIDNGTSLLKLRNMKMDCFVHFVSSNGCECACFSEGM